MKLEDILLYIIIFIWWAMFCYMLFMSVNIETQCTPSQEHQEVMSWINEILQKLD
jgi:hypothetical protein